MEEGGSYAKAKPVRRQALSVIEGGWSGQRWFISAITAHGGRGRQSLVHGGMAGAVAIGERFFTALGMSTLVVLIGECNYFQASGGRYESETQNEKQKRQ